MKSFLVRSGEDLEIIPPATSPITGVISRGIRYYNGTGRGVHVAIGINDQEIFIAHVTSDGADEIISMEEDIHGPSDTV